MTFVRRISPILAVLLLALFTPKPALAATITFTSSPPRSPVTAYEPISHTFTATGDTAISYSLAAGNLPVGVALRWTGELYGAPATPNVYTFTVRATGIRGAFADQTVTIGVKAPRITITSSPPRSPVTAYEPISHTFTATGGTAPHSFLLVSGSLPVGISLRASTGILSGTPAVAGTYNFFIKAKDKNGFESASYPVTIVVQDPTITITSPPPPSPVTTYEPISHTFTASGGTAPHSFSLVYGSLPVGIALSASTGILSGTPSVAGTYNFVIKAKDKNGIESAPYPVSVIVAVP
jgi:hypothetical protein